MRSAPRCSTTPSDLSHPVIDAVAGNPTALAESPARRTGSRSSRRTSGRRRSTARCSTRTPSRSRPSRDRGRLHLAVQRCPAPVRPRRSSTRSAARRAAQAGARRQRAARDPALVAGRLADVGLPGVTASERTVRRDLIHAITRTRRPRPPRCRGRRGAHPSPLGAPRLPGPRSATRSRAARQRARRARRAPASRCCRARPRRPPACPPARSRRSPRTQPCRRLLRAASLGEFRFGPMDSPWYGAAFADGPGAAQAHDLAKRLPAPRCRACSSTPTPDRRVALPPVRHDRRARGLPEAAARHPRDARQVQPAVYDGPSPS